MVAETDKSAPYGPASNVLQLLRRAHDKGLPEKLTSKELERVGVTDDGTARKILRTLRFLKLIDDEGTQLPLFDTFQRATSDEYAAVLAGILREAYADVFRIIGNNPAEASDVDIDNAFRRYDPQSQRARMVLLFQALLREAQLREGGPTERRSRRRSSDSAPGTRPTGRRIPSSSRPAAPHTRPLDSSPSPMGDFMNVLWGQQHPTASAAPQPAPQPAPLPTAKSQATEDEGYASLLGGLIRQLPRSHRWTKERRDMWLKAIEINVDWLVKIAPEEAIEEE